MRKLQFLLFLSVLLVGKGIAADNAADKAVIVRQGTAELTLSDVDAYMQRVPEDKRAGMMDNANRVEQLLLSLLAQQQLAQEARDLGLEKDPAVAKQLALAADEVLARARMKRLSDGIQVPNLEGLAKEKYLSNKADYVQAGQIDVKHVLLSPKSLGEEAARTRAAEVQAKAKAVPTSFDALVEQYSDDPSKASNHGLITNAGSSNYNERFVEAAKSLRQVGDISGVIKTPFGYHVLMLVRRDADRQRDFAEVHDEIVKKLRDDFIGRQEQDHVDRVRNKKLDVVSPELVGELRTRYMSSDAVTPADAAKGAKPGEK